MMSKKIHIFRHGQTDWNLIRRMQGHTDIPLNEEGRKQAQALQQYFKENPVDLFVSSDLSRAQETAAIANAHLKQPLLLYPGFREVSLGILEGMTQEEVRRQFGDESWEKWASLHPENADFHYPQAESSRQAVMRFSMSLKIFCKEHSFSHAGLCTHGFVMRRFLHTLRPDIKEALPIPNCVVYTVEWDAATDSFSFHWDS